MERSAVLLNKYLQIRLQGIRRKKRRTKIVQQMFADLSRGPFLNAMCLYICSDLKSNHVQNDISIRKYGAQVEETLSDLCDMNGHLCKGLTSH